MAKKRKQTDWADVTPEQRNRVANWILDAVHDRAIDEEEIDDCAGFPLLAALRGLAEMITEGEE